MATFTGYDGNEYTILTSKTCKLITYNGTIGGKIKIDYVYNNTTNARYSVTEIDSGDSSDYIFQNFADNIILFEVEFPLVTTIGDYAFYKCYALTSAHFPKAITIGDYAFEECYALTSAHFPKATTIGIEAFKYCYALTSVYFPLVTTIGDYAFYECYTLTSAHFPKATIIGIEGFEYCYALTSVYFPLATTIGDYAFYECYTLQEVSIPSLPSSADNTTIFELSPNITHVYIGNIYLASTYASNLGLNISVFKQYCPPKPYCDKLKILVPYSVGVLITCGYIYNRMQKSHISSKIKKHKHKFSLKE